MRSKQSKMYRSQVRFYVKIKIYHKPARLRRSTVLYPRSSNSNYTTFASVWSNFYIVIVMLRPNGDDPIQLLSQFTPHDVLHSEVKTLAQLSTVRSLLYSD